MVSRLHPPASKPAAQWTARLVCRRLGPWLLALALMTAQLLGTMHRITHAQPSIDDDVAVAVVAGPASGLADASGWIAALFAEHAGADASCELYDAHGQAGGPTVPSLSLPAAMICFAGRLFLAAPPSHNAAPFQARAPPIFR